MAMSLADWQNVLKDRDSKARHVFHYSDDYPLPTTGRKGAIAVSNPIIRNTDNTPI